MMLLVAVMMMLGILKLWVEGGPMVPHNANKPSIDVGTPRKKRTPKVW